MKKKNENYQYLLQLYSLVDDYLADVPTKWENLPNVVVSFCIVTEKILKIKLHNENPVLVYENSKLKDNDALIAIIKKKEVSVETVRIREAVDRYKLMFDDEFSDDEMQVIIDIYNVRNNFIHGCKPDNEILLDKENILKKMGTIWEKIATQAISIFGKDLIKANKPKKKYSEEELEKILIEEVRTKIKSPQNENGLYAFDNYQTYRSDNYGITFGLTDEKCPRCGSFGFSLDSNNSSIFTTVHIQMYEPYGTFTDLYKCKKCNLELTRKEYEIAKKIKNERKY